MSVLDKGEAGPIRLRLPATSANLGPGYDAVGVAMALYLTIDAAVAGEFAVTATGRNADVCGRVEDSLILTTYREVLTAAGCPIVPLALHLVNDIPLGMGCGSSAAALLAGVMLAEHFGGLNWTRQQVLEEACQREGHPDNVAACWAGGMTCSAMDGRRVLTATCGEDLPWKLLVALPAESLSTSKARALLPATYSRMDAVANVQSTALLVSAFALGRGDLLQYAMRDRIHQPYRWEACPLLSKLLPLSGSYGVLGVALSGAGPSILLIAEESANVSEVVKEMGRRAGAELLEVLVTGITGGTQR